MPTKHEKRILFSPWLGWQRSRSALKFGFVSGYWGIWLILTHRLAMKHPQTLIFIGILSVIWGYEMYREIKHFNHVVITPLTGIVWSAWILLALLFLVYSFTHKPLHSM
ncbi:hypothetical protein [Sulfobacillus thermosulfidooxidans]|uniref:hypothetical protein n=1 Tax=Sulfobacillus thermosulfidooxidans TaxID=28034 RepID=UPI0006B5B4B1|nr:hypothetical protein [Sulfobacillus thermosulfidooxidans]